MKTKHKPNEFIPTLTNKQFKKYSNYWDIVMQMSWKTPRATKVELIKEDEIEVCAHLEDCDINFIYAKLCFANWCYEMEYDEDEFMSYVEWVNNL